MQEPKIIKEVGDYVIIEAGEDDDIFYAFAHKLNGLLKRIEDDCIITAHRPELAERLFYDWIYAGNSSASMVPWQVYIQGKDWSMLDELIVQINNDSLDSINGSNPDAKTIKEWLSNIDYLMQIGGVHYFFQKYKSLKLAYVLAQIADTKEGKEQEDCVGELADFIGDKLDENLLDILNTFNCFVFYYTYGKPAPSLDDYHYEISPILHEQINPKVLLRRNFIHYIDNIIVEKGTDLEIDIFDDEFYHIIGEDGDSKIRPIEGIEEHLTNDCWVKRYYVYDNEQKYETYYFLVLCIKNNVVEEVKVLTQYIKKNWAGDVEESRFFSDFEVSQKEIKRDIEMIRKGRVLPDGFGLIDSPVPKNILRKNKTDTHNITIQSAYRPAYMSLVLEIDVDVISDYEYFTYHSSGNAYDDMFSRPESILKTKEEAFDVLLAFVDEYTDSEYNEYFNK